MTSRRIWSGLTYALGLAAGLYLVVLGVAKAISDGRDQDWGWLLFDVAFLGFEDVAAMSE